MPDSLRLPAASAHDVEDEPSGAFAVVRPKTLPRTTSRHALRREAREVNAPDFDRACVAAGVSNAQIARLWGCDEAIVRRVRKGKEPLEWFQIKALPKAVKNHLLGPEMPDTLPAADIRTTVIRLHALVMPRDDR